MIYVLIVLYEKDVFESHSIKSLLKSSEYLQNSTLVLWDNSSKQQKKKIDKLSYILDANKITLIYKHTPENKSLSEIYNYVISYIIKKDSYLCLFDDDSDFDKKYFSEIIDLINLQSEINIFIPKIEFRNVIVSPFYVYFYKAFRFNIKSGFSDNNHLFAINSGLCINSNHLINNNVRYDENLRFYGTDIFFFKNYYLNFNTTYILKYTMKHDLSLSPLNEVNNNLLKRYCEYYRSIKIIYKNSISIKIYIFLHRTIMSIIKKNFGFFKCK